MPQAQVPLAALPAGHTKTVTVNDQRILVCHVAGQFYAIGDVCTHDNGPLGEGRLEGYEVECPRHGARFDVRTGHVVCFPAIRPVPTYTVTVHGQSLLIEV